MNTALTRIRKEYEQISKNQSEYFTAYPIKDDLFTWHFTIRGPDGTEFEGGLYHGVIKLPTSYPLKPPNIMFLNVFLNNLEKWKI
jgi:ubiquitin-conjugating enzyme E2 J1